MTPSSGLKLLVPKSRPFQLEVNLGEMVGISMRLKAESDDNFVDVASFVEKLRQNDVASFIDVGFLPQSIRFMSTEVVLDPVASDSKELKVSVSLGQP